MMGQSLLQYLCDERHEREAFMTDSCELAVGAVDNAECVPHRNDHPPTVFQLLLECVRYLLGGSRDEDTVKGRGFRLPQLGPRLLDMRLQERVCSEIF